jgi:hypothetical protein
MKLFSRFGIMTPNKFFILVAVAGLTANLHAQGDVEAVDYTGARYTEYIVGYINDDTMGWAFSSSQNITIDSLGWLYAGIAPPSTQVVSVGLWSTDGTLLRSTVIDNNSVSINGNFYESINPIFIPAGSTFIVAVGTSGQPISFAIPPASLIEQPLNYAGWAYLYGNGFTFPTIQPDAGDTDGLVPGATFLFQPVPEPSALGLSALGGLLLAWRRRKARAI